MESGGLGGQLRPSVALIPRQLTPRPRRDQKEKPATMAGLTVLKLCSTRHETVRQQPTCHVKTRTISGRKVVGARGFEPPTPRSRTECSTRLSHAPTAASHKRDIILYSTDSSDAPMRPARRTSPHGHEPVGCQAPQRVDVFPARDRERHRLPNLLEEQRRVEPGLAMQPHGRYVATRWHGTTSRD